MRHIVKYFGFVFFCLLYGLLCLFLCAQSIEYMYKNLIIFYLKLIFMLLAPLIFVLFIRKFSKKIKILQLITKKVSISLITIRIFAIILAFILVIPLPYFVILWDKAVVPYNDAKNLYKNSYQQYIDGNYDEAIITITDAINKIEEARKYLLLAKNEFEYPVPELITGFINSTNIRTSMFSDQRLNFCKVQIIKSKGKAEYLKIDLEKFDHFFDPLSYSTFCKLCKRSEDSYNYSIQEWENGNYENSIIAISNAITDTKNLRNFLINNTENNNNLLNIIDLRYLFFINKRFEICQDQMNKHYIIKRFKIGLYWHEYDDINLLKEHNDSEMIYFYDENFTSRKMSTIFNNGSVIDLVRYLKLFRVNVRLNNSIIKKYNISKLPTTIFVDPNLTEVFRLEGYYDPDAFITNTEDIINDLNPDILIKGGVRQYCIENGTIIIYIWE